MKLAPMINESFESMRRSKLIAVQNKKNGELQCKMVPDEETEFKFETISEIVHLTYRTSQVENRTESVPLKLKSSASDVIWWTVIEKLLGCDMTTSYPLADCDGRCQRTFGEERSYGQEWKVNK